MLINTQQLRLWLLLAQTWRVSRIVLSVEVNNSWLTTSDNAFSLVYKVGCTMTTKTNNVLRTDYLQCFEHPDITELYSTPRDFRKLFPDCVEQQTHMKTLKEEFFSFFNENTMAEKKQPIRHRRRGRWVVSHSQCILGHRLIAGTLPQPRTDLLAWASGA